MKILKIYSQQPFTYNVDSADYTYVVHDIPECLTGSLYLLFTFIQFLTLQTENRKFALFLFVFEV